VERVPGGAAAWDALAPEIRGRLAAMASEPPDRWHRFGKPFLADLLMMVSLDCAAGISGDRCGIWFDCMADIAAASRPDGNLVDPVSATVYSSLARDFARDTSGWPSRPSTMQVADRVFYGLFTRRRIEPVDEKAAALFDNRHWLSLGHAIETGDAPAAMAAFDAVAAAWLSDYRHAGEPRFDLAAFPCFEPLPNAALALAKFRDRLPIRLANEEHRLFYLAALLN
jgi:hypothetical protein